MSADDGDPILGPDLDRLLAAGPARPSVELIALGEPTHGEAAFPLARNALLERLVARGVRSVALETDRLGGLLLDDHVRGGPTTHEAAVAAFTHDFGPMGGNPELLTWLRAYNADRPEADRVTLYGFDPPVEMSSAPSPLASLQYVRDYLVEHAGDAGRVPHADTDLVALAGPDERWSAASAVLDPAASPGATDDAVRLRVVADDLLAALLAGAPTLVAATSRAAWWTARAHARTALGLVRYHAVAAEPLPAGERPGRLLGMRAVLMAENLLDLREAERLRGATLVFAHNRHLQRHRARLAHGPSGLDWAGTGAILAALLGDRYVHVAGSLGRTEVTPVPAPDAATYEGALTRIRPAGGIVPRAELDVLLAAGGLGPRTDVRPQQGYAPLDAETLASCDAVLHVPVGGPVRAYPVADLVARIEALPDVVVQEADAASGAPEIAWGDRFCFVGEDRKRPFATVVHHDVPGFDEGSRLDDPGRTPGAHRLNVHVGSEAFERETGLTPAAAAEFAPYLDHARADVVLPHPVYAAQGWVSVVNPGPASRARVDRILAVAHARARERARRRGGGASDRPTG